MISENAHDIIQVRVIEKLKQRYPDIHLVVFLRSMEKANTPGELFDILDTFPKSFPVEWDSSSRRWQIVENLIPPEKR